MTAERASMPAAEVEALVGAALGETLAETATRTGSTYSAVQMQRRAAVRRLNARSVPHAVYLVTPLIRERVRSAA